MKIRRHLQRRLATMALVVVAAPLLAVVPGMGATNADAAYPLRIAGTLTPPKGSSPKSPARASDIVAIDAARRLMFYLYTDLNLQVHIATYDLRPRIPRPIADGVLGPEADFPASTRYTVAYDSKRRQLALVSPTLEVADGHREPVGNANVVVFSTVANKVVARWTMARTLPGYYPMGITYSAVDDRYYTVGEFSGHANVADGTLLAGGKPYGPGSAVVSLSPATGAIGFVRPVPECQQVLYSKGVGSLIVRSSYQRAVMFPCVSGGTALRQTYPGESGLIRLEVDPRDDTRAAMEQKVGFFAISGSYFAGGRASGIATYDGSTDRFYMQSISFKTPGSWVFDGRLTAWVGFVAAPNSSAFFVGINEGMGHLYIGTQSGDSATDGVLVADVRQTPVPAGELSTLVVPSGLIVADPKSNRLFVRPSDSTALPIVMEDMTQVTHGEREDEYDAGTSNMPDTPAAEIFYGIGATGYAAQSIQVGGTGAPMTAFGQDDPEVPTLPPPAEQPPTVSGGTRALMTARVGGIDLRANGASASAQSALPDVNTMKEYEANSPDSDGDGKRDGWPYPVGTCLDAGGRPVKATWRDDSGASTALYEVSCDAAKNVARSYVRMGASGTGGVTVGKGEYESVATRDRKTGARVVTSTYADGNVFDLPGGYVLRLGRVTAATESIAHGTPGSAFSRWTREVDGVRVVGPDGKALYTAPGCASKVEARAGRSTVTDTCQPLADRLNGLLRTRMRLDFPLPYVDATPKGAFAGVEQTKAQYFQQVVINDQGVVYRSDSVGIRPAPAVVAESYSDTTERSRTVTVLAATQANAVFQVNPPYKDKEIPREPVDPGPSGDPGGGTGTGTGTTGGGLNPRGTGTDDVDSGPGANLPPQTAGSDTTAIGATPLNGFFFMRRSLADIVLLILLSGLVLGGAGTLWRRRRLVEVLVTVPRKEAL